MQLANNDIQQTYITNNPKLRGTRKNILKVIGKKNKCQSGQWRMEVCQENNSECSGRSVW